MQTLGLLGVLVASLPLSSQHRFLSWPSQVSPDASAVAGTGDPTATEAGASVKVAAAPTGLLAGSYHLVHASGRRLSTFAVPVGALGQNGEALLEAPAAGSLAQEWFLRRELPGAEYSIENRATGLRLQPPAAGSDVTSGVARGGWVIEPAGERFLVAAAQTGARLAAKAGAPALVTVLADAEERWAVELVAAQPATSDSALGFMPALPAAAAAVEEGVYAIADAASGRRLCAFLTPEGGTGDYEAHLDAACTQEWEVRASAPEPGNAAAAAAPPPVYEVREATRGVVLDAYMVGTFGAHVRGDERKVAQRWFFEQLAADAGVAIGQASDQRFLGTTERGVATVPEQHGWRLERLRRLPEHCRRTCDAGLTCGTQDDGCGGVVSCGTCPGDGACDGNQCLCTPFPCEESMCGDVPDGCGGTMHCGGCGTGETCDAGISSCVAESDPLVANAASAAENATANAIANATADAAVNATACPPCPTCPACCPCCPACPGQPPARGVVT